MPSTVQRRLGDAKLIVEDFRTKMPLNQFERIDVFVDNAPYDNLRENVERVFRDKSWIRDLLCENFTAGEFSSLCKRSEADECLQPNLQAIRPYMAFWANFQGIIGILEVAYAKYGYSEGQWVD